MYLGISLEFVKLFSTVYESFANLTHRLILKIIIKLNDIMNLRYMFHPNTILFFKNILN